MTMFSLAMAWGWIRFKGGGQQSDLVTLKMENQHQRWKMFLELVGDYKAVRLLASEKEAERRQEGKDLRRLNALTSGWGLAPSCSTSTIPAQLMSIDHHRWVGDTRCDGSHRRCCDGTSSLPSVPECSAGSPLYPYLGFCGRPCSRPTAASLASTSMRLRNLLPATALSTSSSRGMQ